MSSTMQEPVLRVLGAGPEPAGSSEPAPDAAAPARSDSWPWLGLLGFRFALLYVVLFVLPFPLTLLQSQHAPQRLVRKVSEWIGEYGKASLAAVKYFGESLLHSGPITIQFTGSGDTLHNWVRAALVATLAATGAI